MRDNFPFFVPTLHPVLRILGEGGHSTTPSLLPKNFSNHLAGGGQRGEADLVPLFVVEVIQGIDPALTFEQVQLGPDTGRGMAFLDRHILQEGHQCVF